MLEINSLCKIVCYKHNQTVHRMWENGLVIENNKDFIVVATHKAIVYEDDGRYWQPTDPCFYVFFKDKWYNIIVTLKDNKVNYYVNLASPYLINESNIMYIDYDLDVSLKSNQLKILDEKEYQHHFAQMGYSLRLDYKLKENLYLILEKIKKREFPFVDEIYLDLNKKYKEMLKENKNGNKD